jgi:lipopolysaccharide export system protein LptA
LKPKIHSPGFGELAKRQKKNNTKTGKKYFFFVLSALILLASNKVSAQKAKPIAKKTTPIEVQRADFANRNEEEIPGAALLTGHVKIRHEGIVLTCNKAYFFKDENYIKAFGDVQMVQGDTLFLNSSYAEYNGNEKKAFATGKPVLRSPDMTLTTDTINFDRNIQQAYYSSYGTIINKDNTLVSKSGRYFASEKKFRFLTAVTLTNPKTVIKSNHLDYYSNSGHSYLFGPSTITSKDNYIYTEKGFYDTKKNLAHFLRKSYIRYKNRLIEGDSLYYDRNREFASATNNVKITDSINKGIIKGHYAEIYKNQDSMYVTKRAVAINLVENDSVYIHGKVLMVTGKPENRIIRAFNNARFYKTDMSGKCDSIHSDQKTALTQLIGRPVIWNGENQMTGDVIHLIGNNKTEKLDSLKVLNNAFIIAKDTIGTGYNQVKGVNLFGRFENNKLKEADIVKNTEIINYLRNDDQELIGIDKCVCSRINLKLEDNKIDEVSKFNQTDCDLYPEKDLPENARKLRGFIWRGEEQIKNKEDIFPPEENEMNDKIIKESKAEMEKENVPMKIRKETLDYDKNNPRSKTEQSEANPQPKAKVE